MNVLLVNPQPPLCHIDMVDSLQSRRNLTVDPELFHLSALTPDGINVQVSSAPAATLPLEGVDLVYATGKTHQASDLYAIGQRCREAGVTSVLGGAHVSALPHEAAAAADSLVVGESEASWTRMMQDFRDGRLQPRYGNGTTLSLDTLSEQIQGFLQKYPGSFRKKRYPTVLTKPAADPVPIPLTPPYPTGPRAKSVTHITREVEASETARVFFQDDDLLSDTPRFQQALAQLQQLDKRWSGDVVLNGNAVPAEVADTVCMGCQGLLLKVARSSEGYVRTMERHAPFVRQLQEKEIYPWFSFTVGYDDDPESVYEDLYTIADRYELNRISITLLTPVPGTPLFNHLEEQGRIIDHRWHNYDTTQVVFKPKHSSPEQLEERYRTLVRAVNRLAFRRMTIALNS